MSRQKVKISERLTVDVTFFNETCWYHIKDTKKNRSLSISSRDMQHFFKKREELFRAGKKVARGAKSSKSRTSKSSNSTKSDETNKAESEDNNITDTDDSFDGDF